MLSLKVFSYSRYNFCCLLQIYTSTFSNIYRYIFSTMETKVQVNQKWLLLDFIQS